MAAILNFLTLGVYYHARDVNAYAAHAVRLEAKYSELFAQMERTHEAIPEPNLESVRARVESIREQNEEIRARIRAS